jgi:hypothetical protein
MCIVALPPNSGHPASSPPRARNLTPVERIQLALDALAGEPISHLAQQHEVSRKFVSQQVQRARDALDEAFIPQPDHSEPVLFHLPVTRSWLRQLVLSLVLINHSPLRGVVELLADVFDYRMSLGTVFNIVNSAVAPARDINARQYLADIAIGVHDEIHQGRKPVLTGIDAYSTYCYLLSEEKHRDGDTWGVRLLELMDQGFKPKATIADAGSGLRAGQKLAMPGVPCRGDVFHGLYEMSPVVRFLENRAYDAMETVEKLTRKQSQHEWRKGRKDLSVVQKLRHAKEAAAKAICLADEVATLYDWLRQDILAVAGPDYRTRCELLDFVVAELLQREPQCAHRIGPIRTMLVNQGSDLLAFAAQLDKDLAALAATHQVSAATARAILQIQQMSKNDRRRWPREETLRQELGGRYYALSKAVEEFADRVVRASSLVENLNSRLRNYFFLRKEVGQDYLELLRFFLNHRRFLRSEHAERVGKSPAELLSGQEHRHWLEILGYKRFHRAA